LCNKIIENRSIIRTQHNPMVVQWMDGTISNNQNNYSCDLNDLSDPHYRDLQLQNNGNIRNDVRDKNANLDSNIPITYDNCVVAEKNNDRSQGSQGSLQHNYGEEDKKEQTLSPDKQSGNINSNNDFKV
jgi:hypothetical protein